MNSYFNHSFMGGLPSDAGHGCGNALAAAAAAASYGNSRYDHHGNQQQALYHEVHGNPAVASQYNSHSNSPGATGGQPGNPQQPQHHSSSLQQGLAAADTCGGGRAGVHPELNGFDSPTAGHHHHHHHLNSGSGNWGMQHPNQTSSPGHDSTHYSPTGHGPHNGNGLVVSCGGDGSGAYGQGSSPLGNSVVSNNNPNTPVGSGGQPQSIPFYPWMGVVGRLFSIRFILT